MDNKSICPDFVNDHIFVSGKKRTICGYFDLDTNALCQHENHTVCLFYFEKHKIHDPWLRKFMDDLGLVIVKGKK